MARTSLYSLCALAALAFVGQAWAGPQQAKHVSPQGPVEGVERAASVESLASRAVASAGTTVYGAFALSASTTVYILVRGPSLRTLGVTQNALDAPWVRLYNAAGSDLVSTSGTAGFTTCLASAASDAPVVTYYQAVRNQPVSERDSCIATTLPAGAYTFSVAPSLPGTTSPAGVASAPSSGEILFEVTLGAAPPAENNQTRTQRLVGGTWTYTYTIISTFSNKYSFSSVSPSTTTPGDYVALGTDEFGGNVLGTYVSKNQEWAVLDPSIIIDYFYVFTFSDNNRVSGCYYQISPSGSTNLSRCYPMTGSRFPAQAQALRSRLDPAQLQRQMQVEAQGDGAETDPAVIDLYLRTRRQFEQADFR